MEHSLRLMTEIGESGRHVMLRYDPDREDDQCKFTLVITAKMPGEASFGEPPPITHRTDLHAHEILHHLQDWWTKEKAKDVRKYIRSVRS